MKNLVKIQMILPGLALAACVAALAYFTAEALPFSAMLIALFLGFSLHPLCAKKSYFTNGVSFAATDVLKFGIVCLGARINLTMIADIGWATFLLVLVMMVITTFFGLFIGRKMGLSRGLSILIAGGVSVCGSAAALALCSVLPRHEKHDMDLVFVIVGVTILSTVGMIVYPFILGLLPLDETKTGVVLGASLHNVAQAVASGFSVSDGVGDTATIVKLMRVSMLAPYILILSFIIRRTMDINTPRHRPAILPVFIIGFIGLTCLNSMGFIPESVAALLIFTSKSCLLISVVAIGIRTAFGQFRTVDPSAIKLLSLLTVILFAGTILIAGVI